MYLSYGDICIIVLSILDFIDRVDLLNALYNVWLGHICPDVFPLLSVFSCFPFRYFVINNANITQMMFVYVLFFSHHMPEHPSLEVS